VGKKAPEIITHDKKSGKITLKLRKGLYPLDAVFGAAYVMIDRAYVFLDKDDDGNILVFVHAKAEEKAVLDLEMLAGEFANEALGQVLRGRIMKEHKNRLETIVAQAVAGGVGIAGMESLDLDNLGLDDLEGEDDDLDFLDDPLGIAVPWEEKYKKSANEQRPDVQRGEEQETDGGTDSAGPGDSGGFNPVPTDATEDAETESA